MCLYWHIHTYPYALYLSLPPSFCLSPSLSSSRSVSFTHTHTHIHTHTHTQNRSTIRAGNIRNNQLPFRFTRTRTLLSIGLLPSIYLSPPKQNPFCSCPFRYRFSYVPCRTSRTQRLHFCKYLPHPTKEHPFSSFLS